MESNLPRRRELLPPLLYPDDPEKYVEETKYSESWHKKKLQKQNKVFKKLSIDKTAFIQYYQRKVIDHPGPEQYILMGDAYIKLFESEKALKCYETALNRNPKDIFLICTLGDALIKTHNFRLAVQFYQEHVKVTNYFHLKLQLGELYINLKQFPKAELLLLELRENYANVEDNVMDLKNKVKLFKLLALVQQKTENYSYAIKTLKDAIGIQKTLMESIADTSAYNEENINLVSMILELGKMFTISSKRKQAVHLYKASLINSPNNVDILINLAKTYLEADDLELCQEISLSILEIDPENEIASTNLIDIATGQLDFENAVLYCNQVLIRNPTNWEVLTRIVNIFRRLGILNKTLQYLNTAKQQCKTRSDVTKLTYCEALYYWYSGDISLALTLFNTVKHDPDIGTNSICCMLEIHLNVENIIEHEPDRGLFVTVDNLLEELKIKLGTASDKLLKFKLLENFRLIVTKDKSSIEKALDNVSSLVPQECLLDNIGVVLGISTALILLQQENRAKTQLKLISKTNWTINNSEYLERCWLLLGSIYVRAGKNKIASKLMLKVLQYNKSSGKAYEYLGFICEKEDNFQPAITYYKQVWQLCKKTNFSVGFRLATCYMKNKQYPDAIVTANLLLNLRPECDIIRTELLEKSIFNLRV